MHTHIRAKCHSCTNSSFYTQHIIFSCAQLFYLATIYILTIYLYIYCGLKKASKAVRKIRCSQAKQCLVPIHTTIPGRISTAIYYY